MSSDFESIASELSSIDEDGMSRVSNLANMQLALEDRVKALDEELKTAKKNLREVAEDQLPAAMAEHNMTKIGLKDGWFIMGPAQDQEKNKMCHKSVYKVVGTPEYIKSYPCLSTLATCPVDDPSTAKALGARVR